MIGSLFRVFLSAVLAQYIASGASIFDVSGDMWKTFVGAGVSSVVLVGYNYLNPKDPRYGKNKDV